MQMHSHWLLTHQAEVQQLNSRFKNEGNSPEGLWSDEKYNPIKRMSPPPAITGMYLTQPKARWEAVARPGAGSSCLSDAA